MLIKLVVLCMTGSTSLAKSIPQFLYEDAIHQKCKDATPAEIVSLTPCSRTGISRTLADLDQTAEYMVFKTLAESERDNLTCLERDAKQLAGNPDVLNAAINSACGKLDTLQQAINNQATLNKSIDTLKNAHWYFQMTDGAVAENKRKVQAQTAELLKNQALEKSIRASDFLLSSPSVYTVVTSQLQNGMLLSGKTPEQVCMNLRKNGKGIVEQDIRALHESVKKIDSSLSSTYDLLGDTEFKRQLWHSGSKETFLASHAYDPDFHLSTYCRMEGRYGAGADEWDKLYLLGTFAVSGGAAVTGSMIAEGVGALSWLGKVATLANLGLQAQAAASDIAKSCNKKVSAMSDGKSCAQRSDAEAKALLYKKIDGGDCLTMIAISLLNVGLSGVAAASSLTKPLALAEQKLGFALNPKQAQAIEDAHMVGNGEPGRRAGSLACIDNYTDEQLRRKSQILAAAGFTPDQRRILMEEGIVGAAQSYKNILGLGNGITTAQQSKTFLDQLLKDAFSAEEAGNKIEYERLLKIYNSIEEICGNNFQFKYANKACKALLNSSIESKILQQKIGKPAQLLSASGLIPRSGASAEISTLPEFDKWFDKLDSVSVQYWQDRIKNQVLDKGYLGGANSINKVGEGVFELKRSGEQRIYFCLVNATTRAYETGQLNPGAHVIFLLAGDKQTQSGDIAAAGRISKQVCASN